MRPGICRTKSLLQVNSPTYGPPKLIGQAERLPFADDDVGAVLTRRREHPEAHRVGGDDEQRRPLRALLRQRLHVFELAEEVRLLDCETRVFCGQLVRSIASTSAPAADPYVRTTSSCRVDVRCTAMRLRPVTAAGHQAGLGQRARAVVHAGVGHVHPDQLTDH